MGTWNNLPVDRRQFVAGAGATMLAGCVSCPDELAAPWISGTREISDVHAHFFNLSDLPVRGFMIHVILPKMAPDLIAVWDSAADVGDWAKARAPTVREERRGLHLPLGGVPAREVSAERFSRELAARINREAGLNGAPPAGVAAQVNLASPARDLQESYLALAAIINDEVSDGRTLGPVRTRVAPAQIAAILGGAVPRAARLITPAGTDKCPVQRTQCILGSCDEPPAEPPDMQLERIWTLIKWVWDMAQGRCNHVHDYLGLTRSGAASPGEVWRPRLIVHHLVDYDAWLGDGPARDSSHDDQIAFWTDYSAYAAREADGLEIVTFAGFDPLRRAQEVLRNEPPLFDRLKTYFGSTSGPRIGGFKLYPPMGFKPSGNVAEDYRLPSGSGPQDPRIRRARGIVSREWNGDPRLARHRIHEKINESLVELFDFCLASRAPILSHSIRANEADCCFGQRANPAHWADLFEREPRFGRLRLCLGHIVNDADCFAETVLAMRGPNSPPGPGHVWALHGIARLLRMTSEGRADVYADIGYLNEILKPNDSDARDFSAKFFRALKRYCEWYDPGCRRIMFGTDWIMIGWELRYRRYFDLVRYGMDQADWPDDWQDNFLTANLRRFLGRS